MKAFILAAGLGTRLRPLTNTTPKVMVRVGGKPVLEHLIGLCRKHGVRELIINLHHLPEKIRGYFRDGSKFGVAITYVYEAKLLGDAGALKNAEKLLSKERFFVLNGDVMTDIDLGEMMAFHRRKGGLGTFLVHLSDHPFDSDLVEYDRTFRIRRLYRVKPGEPPVWRSPVGRPLGQEPVSKSGTHVFEPEVLEHIPAGLYALDTLIRDLIEKGERLYAFVSDAYSKDIGTPERLREVRQGFAEGRIGI